MKATINKSNLMKRAWNIYRTEKASRFCSVYFTFGDALRRAWKIEKREAEKNARICNVTPIAPTTGYTLHTAILNHYSNRPAGSYYGD